MNISIKRKAAVGFVLSAALAVTLFPASAGAVTAAQKHRRSKAFRRSSTPSITS